MKKSTILAIAALSVSLGVSSLNAAEETSARTENLSRYTHQLKHYFPAYGSLEQIRSKVYQIRDRDGKNLGTLYLETVTDKERKMGYAGTIEVAVAVDLKGKTVGVLIGKNQETPSFMQRIFKSGLLEKWNGKSLKEIPSTEIDAVTRATYSSGAIIHGVQTLAASHQENSPVKAAAGQTMPETADNAAEIAKLNQRAAMLRRIVSGGQRLLTQLQTRKDDELKLRLVAATKGNEAAAQFAKENNLMFFNHPGRGKSKVELLGEKYRKDPSETNLKELKAAILENYERMLKSVPPHNAEQEKALAAVQARLTAIQGKKSGTAGTVSKVTGKHGTMKFKSREAREQEAKIALLADAYKKNPDEKLLHQLRREVTKQIVRGVASMSARLAQQEQETERLKKHLAEFLEEPDALIQKRVDTLIGK